MAESVDRQAVAAEEGGAPQERKRVPGVAPVKLEFLRSKPSAPAPNADSAAAAPGAEPADGNSSGAGGNKRKRGMNKPNERETYRAPRVGLCTSFISDGSCEYGEACKFSHDLAAYLSGGTRPPDLPGECPHFTADGFCRHGVLCRFGLTHVDAEGRNIIKPGVTADRRGQVRGERNYVRAEALQLLKRRSYPFAKADRAAQLSREVTASCTALTGRGWGEVGAPAAAAASTEAAAGAPATEQSAVAAASQPARGPEGGAAGAGEQGGGFGCSEATLRAEERKLFDVRGKLYLAPLTTVGNLPFRRLAVSLGADITCSEMALSLKLLQGDAHEWSLLRRHESETFFGAQVACGTTEFASKVCEAIGTETDVSFVDLNMGCPIDSICNKGMGAMLVGRPARIGELVRAASSVLAPTPLTVKLRTGVEDRTPMAHRIVPLLRGWGAAACTLHGRSRQQRYSRTADWEYIGQCAAASTVPLIGNGDIFSYEDLDHALRFSHLSTVMVARGALIKPWIFTELKERRHWDISAAERLEQMRQFVRNGLDHWGSVRPHPRANHPWLPSALATCARRKTPWPCGFCRFDRPRFAAPRTSQDEIGVSRTRHFLLEWLSFTHRYVPIGLLEVLPPRINDRPPTYYGRSDLETLLASPAAEDWVKISEMLLGPVPAGFHFTPKHKASASGPVVAEG